MPKRSFPPRDVSRPDAGRSDPGAAAGRLAPAGPAAPATEPSGGPGIDVDHSGPAAPEPAHAGRARSPDWAVTPEQPVRVVPPPMPVDPPDAPAPPGTGPPPARPRWAIRPTSGLRGSRSSHRQRHQQDLIRRTRRSLAGSHQIAVISLKGGVGRTTTAALLGLTLAGHRDDRIIVLDASPAGGTLADRLVGAPRLGIRDLLERLDEIRTLDEIDRFSGIVGGLRVLASDQDLARNMALNSLEYERVCLLLQRHFRVIVTDGATGPALPGTLALAHSVVVVGSLTVDGAGRASKMLDWLVAHGYRDAAARAVLVLDGDRASDEVDATRLRAHFAARCRAVVEIPHDRHLAQGGLIDAAALASATRDAALELAALVADEFGAVTAGRR